ncbi:MAG: SAM-dependent methyltransferase [Opitutaceae bacterium]
MGSSDRVRAPASPAFRAAFRAAAGPAGHLPFARFMELALYHPEIGYYRAGRERVGRAPGTDFITSATAGPLFGELVAAAAAQLLGLDAASRHTFVELGAEPGQSVLADVAHPFAAVRALRLGDPLVLGGDCIVFSNELFDAQPCVRTVYRGGAWRERTVELTEDGTCMEGEVPYPADRHPAPEGYAFDRPLAAAHLAGEIARQPWRGLFLAFDYGKTERELRTECPAGTARAYHRHRQERDLLARPGEQDLTCHVCWDWIAAELTTAGFSTPALEFQETFFVRRAGAKIAAVSAAEAARFSPRKQALMQLLHPGQLGQRFQVLHARR